MIDRPNKQGPFLVIGVRAIRLSCISGVYLYTNNLTISIGSGDVNDSELVIACDSKDDGLILFAAVLAIIGRDN